MWRLPNDAPLSRWASVRVSSHDPLDPGINAQSSYFSIVAAPFSDAADKCHPSATLCQARACSRRHVRCRLLLLFSALGVPCFFFFFGHANILFLFLCTHWDSCCVHPLRKTEMELRPSIYTHAHIYSGCCFFGFVTGLGFTCQVPFGPKTMQVVGEFSPCSAPPSLAVQLSNEDGFRFAQNVFVQGGGEDTTLPLPGLRFGDQPVSLRIEDANLDKRTRVITGRLALTACSPSLNKCSLDLTVTPLAFALSSCDSKTTGLPLRAWAVILTLTAVGFAVLFGYCVAMSKRARAPATESDSNWLTESELEYVRSAAADDGAAQAQPHAAAAAPVRYQPYRPQQLYAPSTQPIQATDVLNH